MIDGNAVGRTQFGKEPFGQMIRKIEGNKKKYMELLLVGDEQENMIEKYLDGDLFVLRENGTDKACCIVKPISPDTVELKNISVLPAFQRKGLGQKLLEHIFDHYKENYTFVIVGTGDSELTIPFYESCGFSRDRVLRNFFTDMYDHPIFEAGKQLVDMVYLKKKIGDRRSGNIG
jgi:ribosomal protein S18 acetylase RimI-like enzyme